MFLTFRLYIFGFDWKFMAVGGCWGEGGGGLPFLCITKVLIFHQTFLMKLFHYFRNNLRQISSINGYCNVIKGNKGIKSCKFCVKILHRRCREVAKKPWFWRNNLILQNHF